MNVEQIPGNTLIRVTLSPDEARRLRSRCEAEPLGSPGKPAAQILAATLLDALREPLPPKTGILLYIVITP